MRNEKIITELHEDNNYSIFYEDPNGFGFLKNVRISFFQAVQDMDLILAKEPQRAGCKRARTAVMAGVSTGSMEADMAHIRNLGTVPQDRRYVRCERYTERRTPHS